MVPRISGRMRLSLCLVLFRILVQTVPLFPACFVDDDTGLDTNPGTFLSPFRTLQKAADTMMTNATACTCRVFPGTYNETVVIGSNRNAGFLVFSRLSNALPVMNGAGFSNYAFKITNAGRILVSGFLFTQYSNGIILADRTAGIRIERNVFDGNLASGLFLTNETVNREHLVQSNIFHGPGQPAGIHIKGARKVRICLNNFHRNDIGIMIAGSAESNCIAANQIYSNLKGVDYYGWPVRCNLIISNEFSGPLVAWGVSDIFSKRNSVRKNRFVRCGSAIALLATVSNTVISNIMYSNSSAGIELIGSQVNENLIEGNILHGPGQFKGIQLSDGNRNRIRYNTVYGHPEQGILLSQSSSDSWSNEITGNTVYSNGCGIELSGNRCSYNFIRSNVVCGPGQGTGVLITHGNDNRIARNLFHAHISNHILLAGTASNILLVNNTLFGNMSCDGIRWNNSASGTLFNNIILSNGNGANDYGVKNAGSGTVFLSHNDICGNYAGPTNCGASGQLIWGGGNLTGDPMLDTVSSFTVISLSSPVIDSGTNIFPWSGSFNRARPDMGWKEAGLFIEAAATNEEESCLRDNLSSVIVAPNPVRTESGHVVFYNLTQDFRITVFTVTGLEAAFLEGRTVSGKYLWTLKNKNNGKLDPGVYLCRITNSRGGEKLLKLVIIR